MVTGNAKKRRKIHDVYFVNPRYGKLVLFSVGGQGGDGGSGQDGNKQDEKHYPVSGGNGGNGGDGGLAGSFEVVYEPSAREYTNWPCIEMTSEGGQPGMGGPGGKAGEISCSTPGVWANAGNPGKPGNYGYLSFDAVIARPAIKRDTLLLLDSARNRSIPVAYYAPDFKTRWRWLQPGHI